MFGTGRTVVYSIILAILGLSLVGCGQKVVDSVPSLAEVTPNFGARTTVVLMPLADYTAGQTPDGSLRRQVKLQNALAYRLAEHGFFTPVEEDVVQCLSDLGVIKIISPPVQGHTQQVMAQEMENGWSPAMREEILKIVAANEALEKSKGRLEVTKVGLNKGTVQEIGRRFGADYLLRGRIVEYEIRDGQTHNPLQVGILPFFFDTTSNAIFGIADSERYDLWQDLAVGGVLGAVLGSNADTPFNDKQTRTSSTILNADNPRFATVQTTTKDQGGYSNHAGLNAGVWGAVGAGAAYLASKGGKVPEGVVQVSLALQDARDGHVVWANRVEKQVEPVSMWADPSTRTQIDRAVEEAANALVTNLAETLNQARAQAPAATAAVLPPPAPEKAEPMTEETPQMPPQQQKPQKKNPAMWGS